MLQPDLLAWVPPPAAARVTIGRPVDETDFRAYDEAHPEVWRLFCRFTLDRIALGFEHYSSDAILHRIRWETDAGVAGGEDIKINNNWTSFYARKFHRMHPQHRGFFRTRRSRFDEELPA